MFIQVQSHCDVGVCCARPERSLRAFGFGRCMAGSNWFVCETLTGDRASYMESYVRLRAACLDLGATDAEMRAVFHGNARRVYRPSGKVFFKDKKFEAAISCFTESIGLNATNPLVRASPAGPRRLRV